MAISTDKKYRIKRSADQEEQMRYLWQELKIFQDYRDVLMISAIMGYANHAYIDIVHQASDGVQITFFEEEDKDVIDLIAYAHKKEQSVLTDPDHEKYSIFESYANGGFPILIGKLGIDFDDRAKNNRLDILRNYYTILLTNDIYL